MKNVFKPFIPLVLVTGIVAGLFSCLNPLNFNAGESLITIDANLTGTIDTYDITSAVLMLSNNSKSVDVTNVVITQPEWQPVKATDTPPHWEFSGKPKRLEKKAHYLPPDDKSYQVVIDYAYNALEGQIAGTGDKTLSVSLPLPKQTVEIFIYRDKGGKVVVAPEIRDPHPSDTGIPTEDPLAGEGSIPAIIPMINRDKIASFIVVSMTRSQHIDSVNFKASDDRDYTIGRINANDRQSIALGQGAWKTKLVYKREGITNTIGPVNSIIVPSSDPQAVKEHYLYFYLNNMGNYTVSQIWPPVPNDVDENDLLPPDAGFGRSLIKIVNKSYALAKSVTVVNEREPVYEPLHINNDKFTPTIPVLYNKTGYVDVVGSAGFPIQAHESYLVRVTMEIFGGETVEIERRAYIKNQIISITIEQKDLGEPAPAGAKITLENKTEKFPVEIIGLEVRNKAQSLQSSSFDKNTWTPAIDISKDKSAVVYVIDSEEMPVTEGAEYEAFVTLYGSGVTEKVLIPIKQSAKLWSELDPEENTRTITVRDGDVPDGIKEAYYNQKGATFTIKNNATNWPVEITGFKVYNQATPTQQTTVTFTQAVGKGGEKEEAVKGSNAMPIDPGMKFKVDLYVKGNGNTATVTKTISPEELFSDNSISSNTRTVTLENGDVTENLKPKAEFLSVTANGSTRKTSTQLTLTFDNAVTGLTKDHITITGVTGLVKDTLNGSGTTYTLDVSGISANETATVKVDIPGYIMSSNQKTAKVYYAKPVKFISATPADGSATQITTKLTLTFDSAITGLTAGDIEITGVPGLVKGTLSGSGTTYTLPISGFSAPGTASITVGKDNYDVSGNPRTATVYYPTPVTFTGVTADGSATQTSTKLTLTFDNVISGLTAGNIEITGVPGLVKGMLSGSGTTYTLPISDFSAGGEVRVTVTKEGYTISGNPRTATVYYYVAPIVTFKSATADGSATETSTELTLTFDKQITGLTADDIEITGVPGLTKGTLSSPKASGGNQVYTLPINDISAPGTATVEVKKNGYTISGSPQTATVHYAIPVTFKSATANGSATVTSTQVTLTFDSAITELTAGDIAITGVSGLVKGTLSGSGTTYFLPISDFSAGGEIRVTVTKDGYDVSGNPQKTTIYNKKGVYVAGYINLDDTETHRRPCYWANGVRVDLPVSANCITAEATSITVSQGRVYVAGFMASSTAPLFQYGYWVDGVWQQGQQINGNITRVSANAIAVVNGKVYIAGDYTLNGTNTAFHSENGTIIKTYSDSLFNAMVVSNGNVYIAGSSGSGQTQRPYYWKNGTRVTLDAYDIGEAFAITVKGNDVYAAGHHRENSGGALLGVYWVNGTKNQAGTQITPLKPVRAIVLKDNGDIICAGPRGDVSNNSAYYTITTNGKNINAFSDMISSIAISSDDFVYMAGYSWNGIYNSKKQGIYWTNKPSNGNSQDKFLDSSPSGSIESIYNAMTSSYAGCIFLVED